MYKNLYSSVAGLSQIESIDISTNHSSSFSTAVIKATSSSLGVGDSISIDLGYTTNHDTIFTGYVKETVKDVPDNTITITAHDEMVRAVDYFVVSSNPENPFKRSNIRAEFLVRDVLALAGLTDYTYQNTAYRLAISTEAEVNLIGAYDYTKSIADLLAWHLWADVNGQIHFENRKPYVMTGDTGQWGDDTNETIPYGGGGSVSIGNLGDDTMLRVSEVVSEKDLRNRVVVYGAEGVYANAQSSTSYDPVSETDKTILPAGYYKAVVYATPIIDSNSIAQTTADYNLLYLNRLNYHLLGVAEGDPALVARNIITISNTELGLSNRNFYIYSSEHNWSDRGYTISMELRG